MKDNGKFTHIDQIPPGSNNFKSGCWYSGSWRPDDQRFSTPPHSITVTEQVLYQPQLLDAETAAAFAVGLIGRDQLPDRMVPVPVRKTVSRGAHGVESRTVEILV
jgi:hypothetical protein